MSVLLVSYCCMICECLLLFRAWKGKLFSRFPVFFIYILFVLTQSLARNFIRTQYPNLYGTVYWSTEFVGVFLGCAVVFEFSRQSLAGFPGTAKLVRNALLFVFSLTVGKVLVTAAEAAHGWSGALTVQLVRDMRFVQVAAILTLLALFLVYRIPVSPNLKGIVLGYGAYLSISLVNLTYLDHFRADVVVVARFVQSSAYLLALSVWTISLWSYRPVPERSASRAPSYDSILRETDQRLAETERGVEGALIP